MTVIQTPADIKAIVETLTPIQARFGLQLDRNGRPRDAILTYADAIAWAHRFLADDGAWLDDWSADECRDAVALLVDAIVSTGIVRE